MEKYSKILIALNIGLVALNISLLAIVYSDQSSVGSHGLVVGSESSNMLAVENNEEQLRKQKVSSALEKLSDLRKGSFQEESTVVSNEVATGQVLTGATVANTGVTAETQPAIDMIKPGSINDERSVSQEQVDEAVLFKNTYSSTTEKLEALLVMGNYQ